MTAPGSPRFDLTRSEARLLASLTPEWRIQEFLDTKLRPPGSHDVERILGNKIGPVRWYGAPTASAVMEPGPVLTPVLGTRDQIKLLAE